MVRAARSCVYSPARMSIRSRSSFSAASSALSAGNHRCGAVLIEPVGLGPEIEKAPAEIGEACACGEKQFAQIAFAGEDAFAARLQRLIVERKHRVVGVPVEAAEFAQKPSPPEIG